MLPYIGGNPYIFSRFFSGAVLASDSHVWRLCCIPGIYARPHLNLRFYKSLRFNPFIWHCTASCTDTYSNSICKYFIPNTGMSPQGLNGLKPPFSCLKANSHCLLSTVYCLLPYAVGYVDRKNRFPIGDRIGLSHLPGILWKNSIFGPTCFDRAIRSTHPVEKLEMFDGMLGSDVSTHRAFSPPY